MSFQHYVQELRSIHQSGANKVFSMYLNTDPSDPEQQGGKWKIQFKNGLRNFKAYLKEDNNHEELRNFKSIEQKVEKYVSDYEQHLLKGIIIFATADDEVWIAERLQVRLTTEFFWDATPQLQQLEQLIENYPRTGIILVQQNQIKVLEANLNEVEDTHFFELDLNTENWTEKLGPQKGSGGMHPGATNLQKDNFNKKFHANQQRWYKGIASKLDKLAKNNKWEKVFLSGEKDPVHEIIKHMNRNIDHIMYKNMFDHKEDSVLTEVSG